PLFPRSLRPRQQPWTGAEVIASLLFLYIGPLFVIQSLQMAGFFRWMYGADPQIGDTMLLQRCGLWAAAVGSPLSLIMIVATLWFASHTRLRHLGLTAWRWQASLAAGSFAWLIVAPAVFGLHYLLIWLHESFRLEVSKHLL